MNHLYLFTRIIHLSRYCEEVGVTHKRRTKILPGTSYLITILHRHAPFISNMFTSMTSKKVSKLVSYTLEESDDTRMTRLQRYIAILYLLPINEAEWRGGYHRTQTKNSQHFNDYVIVVHRHIFSISNKFTCMTRKSV